MQFYAAADQDAIRLKIHRKDRHKRVLATEKMKRKKEMQIQIQRKAGLRLRQRIRIRRLASNTASRII